MITYCHFKQAQESLEFQVKTEACTQNPEAEKLASTSLRIKMMQAESQWHHKTLVMWCSGAEFNYNMLLICISALIVLINVLI